ncbi:MAG TPA: chemotaxis protein CheD, partial [Aliarcobacter sp.]|nr:chemotaxis protein CheD [Aliarcobacter sp.]
RLILLADNFETFIKVTQKSETDSKILSNEKSLQIEISKAPVIKEYTGAVELFGANKKKIEETMEIELF